MRSIAVTALRTTAPDLSAWSRALRTTVRASPVRRDVDVTFEVISSRAAAVCSRVPSIFPGTDVCEYVWSENKEEKDQWTTALAAVHCNKAFPGPKGLPSQSKAPLINV